MREHEAALLTSVESSGYRVVGRPTYARYDPPWTPPFLRSNEILVPVAKPSER